MHRTIRRHNVTAHARERADELKFSGAQLQKFSEGLAGHIVLPQDAAYDSARETFMKAFQHFPQIIVYCAGFSDVVASIHFAQDVGLHPVCRSGGHSTAGYSVNDEMVIDFSNISYVRVEPKNESALVGAGSNFGHVNSEMDLYGLHVPGGGCPTVCVGGFMQGGGYGFTSLMLGMNCDSVTGVQVALADGRIVTANAGEHEDLFWAVRGGTGNNFGALLEIEYGLRKLGPLWGFGFKWPLKEDKQASAAAEALTVWQSHFTGDAAPPHVGQQALLVRTKEKPDGTELGQYFVIRGMYNGSEAACRKALDPLFALLPAESYRDIWQAGSYRELNGYLLNYPTELPANVPPSARSLAKSHIVARSLTAAEWGRIIELFRASPNQSNFIGLEAYGGAINAPAPDATAFWHRRAAMDVFLFSFWLDENHRETARAYVADFDRLVGPLSNGHSYQNYPNPDNKGFGKMYFGGNLKRLVEVKGKYDPGDFFRFPQGLSGHR
jgi:FAD/FMN-containing dehydrogenase